MNDDHFIPEVMKFLFVFILISFSSFATDFSKHEGIYKVYDQNKEAKKHKPIDYLFLKKLKSPRFEELGYNLYSLGFRDQIDLETMFSFFNDSLFYKDFTLFTFLVPINKIHTYWACENEMVYFEIAEPIFLGFDSFNKYCVKNLNNRAEIIFSDGRVNLLEGKLNIKFKSNKNHYKFLFPKKMNFHYKSDLVDF